MFQHVMQNSEAEMFSSTQILESLQHPVLVVDANSEITYANATAAASFGGWIVGLTLADIFSDYLRPASIGDGPSSMRLMTRQSEAYDALLNPVGGGNICVSFWPVALAPIEKTEAKTDDLTGLALRNTFMATLERALPGTAEGGSQSRCFASILIVSK